MRRIPLEVNGNHNKPIGWINIEEDAISDEMLANCSISWYTRIENGQVLLATLVPNFRMSAETNRVVTRDEETVEIDGQVCVVVHLGKDDNHRYFAACDGARFNLPSENDRRPRTLCEACRLLIIRGGPSVNADALSSYNNLGRPASIEEI